jgi:cytochrome P450
VNPNPPGPPAVTHNPLSLLRYARAFRKDPIAFVGDRFARYGDLYATTFRGVPLYVTRHPEHLHEVLVSRGASFKKPEEGITARQLRRMLGRGLVTSNGDFWRRQRRMINPAFGRKQIEALGTAMVDKTLTMLDRWTPGETREVGADMMALTLNIVARTLFDHDPTGERDRIAGALGAFRDITGLAGVLPPWVPLPSVRRMRRSLADMDDIVYGLIDARRAEPDERLRARGDLLSALVLARAEGEGEGAQMTRTELRDEILTLFLAGHETTSQTLTWTWYLLSQHPAVEAQLHAELDAVLGGRPPTAADALPVTDRILQESMRVYPPVTTVTRVATEPVEVGGYRVPAGADVACWIYFAHHDPRWWDDPARFDPDRFLPERAAKIPRGAYAPFGAGQRQCIGKNFALLEARLLLATIAQRFSLRLVPGHPVERLVAVTMSPRHGMKMTLRAR